MATTTKELTSDTIVRRTMILLKEQGRKDKELMLYLGLLRAEICAFLETTPTYLFVGAEETDFIDKLTPMGNEVTRLFWQVNDKRRCVFVIC